MMVKICGITNKDDADAAVEAGASALGFNFYRESPRYISPTGASLIAEKLPEKVLKVGVFVDEKPDTIAKIALQAGLDIAQLHGESQCAALRVWRVCSVPNTIEFDSLATKAQSRLESILQIVTDSELSEGIARDPNAEAILLDTASIELRGGTGLTFRWGIAKEAAKSTDKKIIVAGGLDEDNVQMAIAEAQPWGVDACSRLESSPGRKDRIRMRKFIQAALAA